MKISAEEDSISQTQQTKQKDKERLQFDFTLKALQRLDMLREISGATSRAEVVRNSLRLYDWFLKEVKPKSTIQIIDEQGNIVSMFKGSLLIDEV
jgi:hypothetical protein